MCSSDSDLRPTWGTPAIPRGATALASLTTDPGSRLSIYLDTDPGRLVAR